MLLREAYARERRMGRYETLVSLIRKSMNRLPPTLLADYVDVKPEDCISVIQCIKTHPDWDNDQIAEEIDWED